MQKNSDAKRGSVMSAIVIAVISLALASIFILLISTISSLIIKCFLILYTVVLLAVGAGIFLALRQRLKELNSGEAEKSKKY